MSPRRRLTSASTARSPGPSLSAARARSCSQASSPIRGDLLVSRGKRSALWRTSTCGCTREMTVARSRRRTTRRVVLPSADRTIPRTAGCANARSTARQSPSSFCVPGTGGIGGQAAHRFSARRDPPGGRTANARRTRRKARESRTAPAAHRACESCPGRARSSMIVLDASAVLELLLSCSRRTWNLCGQG